MAQFTVIFCLLILLFLLVATGRSLRISWVTPTRAGIAGGTTVKIYGSGFATDAYSSSNLVYLGNIPCQVNWYTATVSSLECVTAPYPDAQEGNSSGPLQIQIISNGVHFVSYYHFRYDWNYTPQVRAVVPSSGPLGSVIEIGGYRFQSSLNRYERFFLGGSICDPRAPGTNAQYGGRWRWPLYYAKCITTEQQVGGWNASAFLRAGYSRGASWNHSEALYPMHDWKLAMYELFPDIHSIFPPSGSDQGGTLLTIQGTGFGINTDDISVDVDGIPCQIISHSASKIQCWTGRPPAGSPAVASDNNRNPITDRGYRFRGSRGVRLHQWRNIAGGHLSNLHSSSRYPDNPNRYGIRPSFSSEDSNTRDSYGERLMAFFNPHASGLHTFFLSSDDEGGLWIAQGNNITDIDKIASNPYSSGWNNFARNLGQRSEVLNLTEGEDYLLVGELKEAGGGDYIQVGVLMHEETSFTYAQTQKVNRERQLLQLTTEGLYDIQVLQVAINKSDIDSDNPPEFFVNWGGRTSDILPVLDLETNPDLLDNTVVSLFNGVCDFGRELGVRHYDNIFDFEGGVGSSETWRGWNGKTPEIVEDESFCGRHSLYVEESRATAINLPVEEGFRTSDYPFLCLAYKLPPDHPMGIAINIPGIGWRTIQVSSTGRFSFTVIGSFADHTAERRVYDDDRWHYQCVDLQSLLRQGLATPSDDPSSTPEHRITGFGFYSDPDPERRGFHVDEVSFSSEDREVRLSTERYLSPARPNGIALHEIVKTRQLHPTGGDANTFNLTIAMEIIPASCDYDIPLMNITLVNESTPGVLEFSVFRTQSASVPLGGSYTLSYKGATSTAIPHNAEKDEIEEALEALPGLGDVTAWYYSTPLPQDRLGKFCPGRRAFIQFEDTPGDLPLLGVDTGNLTGDGLEASIREDVTGGLFLRPIPGHMLQTVETTPQVHVKVKGQLAACSGGHSLYAELTADSYQDVCGFTYSPSLTPSVSYILPTNATSGDVIQIHGNGFSSDVTENFVLFGGINCDVTSSSSVMIECTLSQGTAGTKSLYLHVLSTGVAESEGIELWYQVEIHSISVTEGSDAGGTEIVIMGTGFVPQSESNDPTPADTNPAVDYTNTLVTSGCSNRESNIVLIGDNECTIFNSTYTTISCITPENTGLETTYNVTVTVLCEDMSYTDTLTNGYTYNAALTPNVTSVTPEQGSVFGGEMITISGSGFSEILEENTVMIGSAACRVDSSTSTQITCTTPPHGRGSANVNVRVEGKGRASGDIPFVFLTEVSSLSHCSGSIFGGQVLAIDGIGFGDDPSYLEVSLGDHPCQLVSVSDTRVICITGSTSQTHQINNNARHENYGLGYRWSPDNLTIHVGDTVEWAWTRSSFTTRTNVAQVERPGDTEYNGYGFRSQPSITGRFSHSFTTPGTYYYIAEGYGHIGFGGEIRVQGLETQEVPLRVTINSILLDLSDLRITCEDTTAPFTHYSYSVSDTPVVSIVMGSSSSEADYILLNLQLISAVREDNVLTLGGLPCGGGTPVPIVGSRSEPDFSSPRTSGMYYSDETQCTVPFLAPGHHRIVLHVAGKGWAHGSLDTTTLDIRGVVDSTPSQATGSLRGGIKLSIQTRGLTMSDIPRSRVSIGNTPCHIQTISYYGDLTCVSQPAINDGYSSVVYHDQAVAYWSLQADYFESDGTYIDSDGAFFYRSSGTLGHSANATVFGEVVPREVGISGNSLTDQSALFNASYIEAPALSEFSHPAGFGIGLWVKTPDDRAHYRIMTNSASFEGGISRGFLLLLNPCNELESWVAVGEALSEFSSSVSCQLIMDQSDCSQPCTGYITVSESTIPGSLPAGVWHVIRSMQSDWSDWHFVSFGWEADDDSLVRSWRADSDNCTADRLCSGTHILYIDSSLVNSSTTTHLRSPPSTVQLGGTSQLQVGITTVDNSSQLGPFAGHLDEISFYQSPLSSSQVERHHYYGSSENQPIWIVTDAVDGVGTGVVPNVVYPERDPGFEEETVVDWDVVQEGTYTVGNATAIRFQWNGLHGVRQVTRSVYESCDLEALYVRQWAPNQQGGDVTVWVDAGGVYYFIDSVVGGCLDGTKTKVTVGEMVVVDWHLTTYRDLTITEGTGLLFQWAGPVQHNVIEMVSPLSVTQDCKFVNLDSKKLGQVVREWHAIPTTSGEVAVTGLSVGRHHFVCSVLGHCQYGMRFTVTVVPDTVMEEEEEDLSPVVHTLPWRIQRYEPLTITRGETIRFVWEGFHSLHQSTKEAFDSCDLSVAPLYEWGEPSVDNSVSISSLSPGTYYFICAVSGHCDAGMKIQVNVLPADGLPVISDPVVADCRDRSTGQCSFAYSTAATPELLRVEPGHSHAGTTLRVYGRGLVDPGATIGTETEDIVVWIGDAPCSNVTIINSSATDDILECIVADYESHYYPVDVFVEGKGFASVSLTPLRPGPLRNATHPVNQLSPYPIFFLAATATSITPNNGSLAGGTHVLISGSGFSLVSERVSVMLGNIPCQIVSSSVSEISCITGASLAGSDEEVALGVRVNGFPASSSLQYTYTSAATPTITAVSGGSNLIGGDIIQISGQNFANDMSLLQVQIAPLGDNFDFSVSDSMASRLCSITAVSETSITCTVPSLAAGSHQVLVHVRGLGLAKPQGNVAMVTYTLEIEDFSPSSAGNGGGVQLTIFGSGFPTVSPGNCGANIIVRVCQAICNITESSVSQLNCTLGANNIPSPFTTSTSCNISITYRNIVANSTTPFNFIGILTPRLDSISPTIGGTAGGTTVTISGSGFFPPGVPDASSLPEQDLLVTIDGSVCEWFGRGTTLTATTIACRTSEHRTTLQAEVKVFVQGRGNALNGNGPVLYEYVDRWSSVYTWGGGPLPQLGDSVYIKQGQTVFLDVCPPVLNLILIEGALIFEDEQDLCLQAKYIFINHGKLQVGTEGSPFHHVARITLHGSVTDPEIPIYGAKVIGIRQGELDLHGRPRSITWVRLAETANASDTSLHVQQPVDWVPGDRIVIAPTGKDGNETEEATIDSVSDDGTQINLVTPLNHTHHGVREVFEDGQFIEMRAEVGLLSHNVVVEGTRLENLTGFEGLGADKYGVQIFVHRMGPHPTPIRIEHTEVRNAGQAFRLGRYAIHFHLSGSMNGSYVRHCAIQHSFNRAITAHGVHHLLIEGNVAYDIMGHTYFVEDGIETYNRYLGNLGVLTRGSSSLLNTDQIPATFWITNPLNTFIGNAAAASRAYGFWYDLDNNPSGASFTRRVCPNRTPFGEFRDNVAHTCNEFGLRIWERYTPFADACAARQPSVATLYNFTSYANGIHGLEFSVVGHVRIVGFKVADNVENGIEIQETLGSWGGPIVQDTLVVSHTSINTGEPQLGGIKTPNTPKLTISNVTFVNFDLPRTSCLRACSHCKVLQGGFQVWFEGLSFLGGSEDRKMFFQWEHEVLYYDLDGTLTGSVGGWATPNSELHPPQHCTKSVPEFSLNPIHPGTVCTRDVHFLRMALNQATPLTTLRNVGVNVSNEFGFSLVPWRHYRLTHMDGYMFTMPSGYEHTLDWTLRPQHRVDTTFYRAGVYGLLGDDRLWITHEFVVLPDHVNIGGNYEPTVHGGVPTSGDPHLSWHINNETNTVTYLISGVNRTGYNDVSLDYRYEPCPRDGCPPPGIDFGPYESFQRRWSDPGSWPSGALPEEGEDVIISSRWRMLMDMTPPPLREVFVLGELMFEDQRDYNFTANLILIQGPNARLIIGTEASPFTHHVVLTLTGRRSDDDLPLTRTLNLGSKVIGVFGNLSIHGVPKTRTWTRLASSARAGDEQIVLQGNDYPDWQVGEEVVIAASQWDPEEAEIRTISNYDANSGTITLDTPLQFDHIVHRFLDPSDISSAPYSSLWWGDGGSLAPEVGLLTHNIVIQGGEDSDEPLEFNHYGCRLLAGSYSTSWFTFTGHLKLDSVEFRYCGQGGYFSPRDPRYTIAFRDSFNRSGGSYVRRCSIHHGYNTAIGIHTSDGIEISQNVIWRTTDSSIKVGGRNNTITDNLAMMTTTVQPNNPQDNHAVDFPATFDVDGRNIVRGNAAAGSTRIAFRFAGEPCLENDQPPTYEEANFWDNTAHTGLLGLSVLGLPSSCTSIGGFSAMFQWNYGVFSSTASSLVTTHLKIAAGKVGLNLNIFGPNPVEHFLGRKSITIADSLIVGSLPGESCQTQAPNYRVRGSVTIAPENHTLGIMMSSFNQRRSKMDGTGAWHLMKGYPVIDGVVHTVNLSFARFFDLGCDYGIFAIGNNPISPDAVHPMHMRGTAKFTVNLTSLAFFYEPDVKWIVQEDCVDMDCDGPKHALIRDLDGRFVDSFPAEGSIVPFAELRFGDYSNRLPVTWLASTEFGERARADQVVEHMGIARGETGNLDNPNGGCVFMPQWQAYSCKNLQHHMFVIESMDADTETRRLSPIALDGGNTGNGDYTDLLNGPMDHGWCTYYTCLKRLSTFFSVVAVGTDYCVWMTGSSPSHLRFHLLNAGQSDTIKLCVWFKTTQRKDVYKNGIFIEPENVVYFEGGGVEQLDDSRHIPTKETSFGGANYFERASQIMHLVIRGSDPIEIRTPPVVQVSLNLAVSLDDFFNVGELINNLAFVLRISPSSIRVVNIVAEDQPIRNRRSLLAVTETNQTTITLEFGNPPPLNVSTPEAPSVAQEINMAGETNDSVDLEGNMLPEAPAMGTNPLNEDPPSSIEQFAGGFNVSVSQYNVDVEAYQQALSEVEEVNELGDQIVNLILLNGTSVIENATITGFSVVPAAPPIAPSPPFIPPEFENATINGEPVLTPVEEVTTPRPPPTTGEGESVRYTIPAAMRVTMEPQEETGHLVHVAVTLFDTTGQPVPNLGLVHSWMCEATLIHNQRNRENVPQLGGQTSVPFAGGVAEFTRLRVDRPSQLLTLKFSTNPSRFVAQTSVQFDVVIPPENTQRERVVFVLAGSTGTLPGDEVEVEEVVRLALWRQLDIDVSRIQGITVTVSGDGEVTVEVDLLERYPTDPPNVPALRESVTRLQTLVNSQQLVVTIGGEHFTAVSGSFDYPTLPSPSSPSPVPLNLTTILIIVCSSVGGVLCVAAACVFGYYCTGQCGRRRRRRKERTSREERIKRVEHHYGEEDESSSDDSDIYLERTTHPPSPSHPHIPTNLLPPPHPHVPISAESPSDSGMETDQDSIAAMSTKRVAEDLFSNQYADCWSDMPSSSHLPQLHSKHKPTVTLSGLANPGYGLPPAPLWSPPPPPPPVSATPPDWTQRDRAHNMAAKRK